MSETSLHARAGGRAVGEYASLLFRFRVIAGDARLGSAFAHAYASQAADGGAVAEERPRPSVLELARDGDAFVVRLDDGPEVRAGTCNAALVAAMTLVDQAAVHASRDDLLVFHAATVLLPAGPAVLAGPSGAGKTTLAAALAAAGHPYAGDEAIGLDRASVRLLANPKPFKLADTSLQALHALGATPELRRAGADDELVVAPADLGARCRTGWIGAPGIVVQVVFTAGARSSVTALSRADVAEVLADQCFNFARWGADGLDRVAAVARVAVGVRLEFGDLDAACRALEGIAR